SANFLHEELDIPHQYLRQLLTNLSKSGFIIGTRGREGGFILGKKVDEIYLAEIIDSIEGLEMFNTCIMGFKECPFDNKCAMHETWIETRDNIISILKNTSLAEFKKK
ncbi:MAG: Rrf2 family transcriptional regulator, partial [Bacteroidales bacterium]|nr:Rrf2 family transcriptional regulator [Bacteroidales bacterium]